MQTLYSAHGHKSSLRMAAQRQTRKDSRQSVCDRNIPYIYIVGEVVVLTKLNLLGNQVYILLHFCKSLKFYRVCCGTLSESKCSKALKRNNCRKITLETNKTRLLRYNCTDSRHKELHWGGEKWKEEEEEEPDCEYKARQWACHKSQPAQECHTEWKVESL